MNLYESRERTGVRTALAVEESGCHHPDMTGWWDLVGPVSIERGDKPYKGADSDLILDTIDVEGVFIWVANNA